MVATGSNLPDVKSAQTLPFPQDARLLAVRDALVTAGGRPIVVGGAVRDHLVDIPSKDIDIEVFDLSLEEVEQALQSVGQVHAVGRSFGVLKVSLPGDVASDEPFDVSLPRTESKVGRGHRGFVVESDPSLSFSDAAARRDFTLNAMGWDLHEQTLLDPHGGLDDLRRGVLRHVSDAFDEDPLRVLRGCQFAARFSLSIAPETVQKCLNLQPELSSLAPERLWEEMKKLLLKAPFPSIGLWALRTTGALSLFPELAALVDTPQEREWHPEGDVWVHTLLVTDEAVRLARENDLDEKASLIAILGALCHDLGKPPTTAYEDGRIRSRGHESAGEEPTRTFLTRLQAPPALIDAVVPLVRDHLKPFMLYKSRENVSDGAIRRLALRTPVAPLALVARADCFGRTTIDAILRQDPATDWLLERAKDLAVEAGKPKALLLGRHLIAFGFQPGRPLGRALALAFEAQLDGAFASVEDGLHWVELHRQTLVRDANAGEAS